MLFSSKLKDKKIGIFYICTGKYSIFWKRFYESAEQYFCPDNEKKYFLFTDDTSLEYGANVQFMHQEKMGWPYDTLMRFHLFNKVKEEALQLDYLFFFNANMVFLRTIKPREILPTGSDKFVSVIHPYYYETPLTAPFEKNPDSLAYFDPAKAKHYYQGCLSGGTAAEYLEMSRLLIENIDKDLKKDIISVWWDESHMNVYLNQRDDVRAIDPGFAIPELRMNGTFPYKGKIMQLDKSLAGGHEFLRT